MPVSDYIVIDVGCQPYGSDVSVEPLIDRFHPVMLFGFDPHPDTDYRETEIEGTIVIVVPAAAWTSTGIVDLAVAGIDTTVMREKNSRGEWDKPVQKAVALDLAAFIKMCALVYSGPIAVKLDAEGAEFPLLEHLHDKGADTLVERVLVEWHDEKMVGMEGRREALTGKLRCEVEEWA